MLRSFTSSLAFTRPAVAASSTSTFALSSSPFVVISTIRSCSSPSSSQLPPESQRATPGPYKKVGNIFICVCNDIPAKYTPQINKILRDLRFEFRGQVTVHPDTPMFREKLFRVRHIVSIEMIPLDEMKDILCVPQHVNFTDLEAAGLNKTRGVGAAVAHPYLRSMHQFLQFRKNRIQDIMERDQVEVKLLEAKKKKASSTKISDSLN